MATAIPTHNREQLLFNLCEAAEIEHNLMCTYLYAAFSLKGGVEDGLSAEEAQAVVRWRRAILDIAIDEMGHLVAVWNITSALGGAPPLGRDNFPISPGRLPAGIVVKLAPFGPEVLQHFIYLERYTSSTERDGVGFEPEFRFERGVTPPRLTPMPVDYSTVGEFYASLEFSLQALVDRLGEDAVFCGNPLLQLSSKEVNLSGARLVTCTKSALEALKSIVVQGEGAPENCAGSHLERFIAIRDEFAKLKSANPMFEPALPVVWNPVLRRPIRSGTWIENEDAAETVDFANSSYALMIRLMAYSYAVASGTPEKALAVSLGIGLMKAVASFADRAARLPIGPSNPGRNAGISFSALRDTSSLPPGPSAGLLFIERLREILSAARKLAVAGDARSASAVRLVSDLVHQAELGFSVRAPAPKSS